METYYVGVRLFNDEDFNKVTGAKSVYPYKDERIVFVSVADRDSLVEYMDDEDISYLFM